MSYIPAGCPARNFPASTAPLADSINEAMGNEYEYVYDRSQVRKKRDAKEIGISAVRAGTIVGEHEVIFAGTDEVIEFKHTAYSILLLTAPDPFLRT